MDDEWDLQAVVRGFSDHSTTNPVNNQNISTTTTNDHFPSYSSSSYNIDDDTLFDFSGFLDDNSLMGLDEGYQAMSLTPPPHPPQASIAALPTSIPGVQFSEPFTEEAFHMQPPLHVQRQDNSLQFNNPVQIHPPLPPPSELMFTTVNPNKTNRKRKNQPRKIIRQMTEEEINADAWAWRKYGQKPIKGSPYPRNYFRCSTSKGCGARKHVERSLNDDGMFIVSYSGEHTHALPMCQRSSLAGITRNRHNSNYYIPISPRINNNNFIINNNGLSIGTTSFTNPSGSTATGSRLLPTTQIQGQEKGDDDDENNQAMLNELMNDDDDSIIKAFLDSDDSLGNLFPRRTSSNTTSTSAGVDGY